jgi:hypothetical protein
MEKVWVMLQKWLTLLNKEKFIRECLKNCENLDKEHINLPRTEIWWLSRGRVLNRVFELKGELQECFQENSRPHFAE